MKRRTFLLTAAAAAVAATIASKPSDIGAPYSSYFEELNQELKQSGGYQPTMLVDLDIMDSNIQQLKSLIGDQAAYRIVVKSLPSKEMVQYIMRAADTNRLMVFHQPFINAVAKDIPNADVLIGKPMPVKAAQKFYDELDSATAFDPAKQLQWLIDTPAKLDQYLELAKTKNLKLRINCEVDVGLHRGGLNDVAQLDQVLKTIDENSQYLEFSGFMGYDPHVVKLPEAVKTAQQAYDESQAIYQSFIDRLMELKPNTDLQTLTLNGAGSPSLELHRNKTVCNDLSAGSCLVKPTDFDIPSLANMRAASFIASPVLKTWEGVYIPSLEKMSGLMSRWNPNRQQTVVIYGGKWMADYESPKGLAVNGLFGTSTNQQLLNGSDKVDLKVDDHVFLRPHQSEFVFLQFGDIQTLRNGKLADKWPIFSNS